MTEMIAYCGLNCADCDMFKATQLKDLEWKKRIAERWTKQHGIEFAPSDVDCNGCKSDKLSGWCRKICKVRPCAEKRNVNTCAHCSDYSCATLKEFLTDEPIAEKNLKTIRRTLPNE